jgi:zinc protease
VIVGSFEVNAIKPLVEQYLGALPSAGRKEKWKDTGIRYAKGVVERRVEKGVEPQSQTSMAFTGAFEDNQEQRVAIRALAEVLQTRLRERLREDLGGTYSVGANASYSRIPVGEYSVTISFGSAPDRVEGLVKAALEQVELLKNEGPTEQQVADAKQRLLRDYETNTKTNSYFVQQLSLRYQNNEDVATLFAMDKEYAKITAATIKESAKRYLNPANLVRVSLFPEKKSNP